MASTLAIIADLGVPQKYLVQHLQQSHVRIIYQLPQLSMTLGVILLAVGYSVDVGERAGCDFLNIWMPRGVFLCCTCGNAILVVETST